MTATIDDLSAAVTTLATNAANQVNAINIQKAYLDAAVAGAAGIAAAEASVAATLATIKSTYYGAFASAPTSRPDGTARQMGDRYYDSMSGAEKTWNGSAWYIPNIDTAAMAAPSGSALIGLNAGSAAVAGTLAAHFKGEINITDFPWLVQCDSNGTAGNGTDNTAALASAFTFGKTNGYRIYHPGGICRVTAGFVQSVAYHNLMLRGNGNLDAPVNGTSGESSYMLDSTDSASFFLSITGNSALTVHGVNFRCAQFVQDRDFIKSSATLYHHNIEACTFQKVERPIVYKNGGYFQNASYRNIMFLNSGTFHSDCSTAVGSLVGTLMVIDNVNHDGSVPANTEKKVCNLTGIRQIEGRNFLLEGALPAAGWTVLKLANPYDGYFTRQSFGQIQNFHSEWSGFAPDYVVDQVGGLFKITSLIGITAASKYKLSQMGRVVVEETSFSGTTDEPSAMFELGDNQCMVDFISCAARTLDVSKAGFNHHNTQYASSTNGAGQVILSNEAAQEIWRWRGGYIDGGEAAIQQFGGGTYAPSTDATYGRKLVLTPNAGALATVIRANTGGVIGAGDQVVLMCRAKLPTYATGSWAFTVDIAGTGTAIKYFDSSYSGTVVDVMIPWVLTGAAATVGMTFSNGTTSGATGNLEVYDLAIYHGNSVPRRRVANYPKNIITYASAMPTTGSWNAGDRVIITPPSVGSPKAYSRITTGSGNVATTDWVSEGNL